jgi:hypothetical protein
MRDRRRDAESTLVAGEDTRYCMLCDTYMTFEQVDEHPYDEEPAGEWICVSCGSAVYVDPPIQLTASA